MTTDTKSIRVNLRFGTRTDPGLLNAVAVLNPYARAKLIRKLTLDGWRLQQEELGTATPDGLVVLSSPVLPNASESQFSDGVLSLLGNDFWRRQEHEP